MAFGESLSGYMGNPATYYFYRNVGAAPDGKLCTTIPLALYSLFQLKFAIITPVSINPPTSVCLYGTYGQTCTHHMSIQTWMVPG